ncbi:MAG: tRNA (N(6)-L-threonylcarbamoyladenosine(37)-C(2))-methylthiotransferase MtaB [Bacteroidia bacterium]|nr:tRNA (N(6)-L-threonylcarbamoyladenosine(37)-C(2))-methylthiotransferase MtaB [Bacteroidia bacterium]
MKTSENKITGRRVAFHTLGCKLNFAETSTIARQLVNYGYEKVSFDDVADVYVINTCSVTNNADKECRQIVRRVLLRSPKAFIAVTGCYAQLQPEEVASIEGVDLVLGAAEKFNISNYIQSEKNKMTEVHSCEINELQTFNSSYSSGDRTRSFLKVQDGCDYTCTYCTIPFARGKSRSASMDKVVEQAKEIAGKGIKEIVLTGVNTGDFGKNDSSEDKTENFFQIICALDLLNFPVRFRISSIEPNLLTDEIISFVAQSEKFVPHFHIPLQSGSNKILGLMSRRYRKELYSSRVEKIKSLMPQACIGCDVIVGFPGEMEADFLETYQFINALDISYLHVFTYSERPDTAAITLEDIVPIVERRKRNQMLRILSEKKLKNFYRQNEGRNVNVLWETENKNGIMEGYSENYLRVKISFDNELVNSITRLKFSSCEQDRKKEFQEKLEIEH